MATMQSRLADLITAIGTDYKQFRTWITGSASGDLTGLNTTAKTSLLAAINEVNTLAGSVATPDATTTVKGKVELATDVEALALTSQVVVLTPGNIGSMTNVANGLLKLDGSGLVPAARIPGSIDDVLEYANFAGLPASGTAGKMYVTLDNSKVYRWSGSAYVEISASPGSTDAVPEGSVNLYFTNLRADARADARITALVGNTDTDLAAAYTTAKA